MTSCFVGIPGCFRHETLLYEGALGMKLFDVECGLLGP